MSFTYGINLENLDDWESMKKPIVETKFAGLSHMDLESYGHTVLLACDAEFPVSKQDAIEDFSLQARIIA